MRGFPAGVLFFRKSQWPSNVEREDLGLDEQGIIKSSLDWTHTAATVFSGVFVWLRDQVLQTSVVFFPANGTR